MHGTIEVVVEGGAGALPVEPSKTVTVEWPLWWGLLVRTPAALVWVAPWLLFAWALFFRENRNRRAWAILLPTALSLAILLVGSAGLRTIPGGALAAPAFVAAAAAVVGLRAERLAKRRRWALALVLLASAAAVGALAMKYVLQDVAAAHSTVAVLAWLPILVGLRCWRRCVRGWRLFVWLAVAHALGGCVAGLLFKLTIPYFWYGASLVRVAGLSALGALGTFVLQWPFFILAWRSALYRARFGALLGRTPQTPIPPTSVQYEQDS